MLGFLLLAAIELTGVTGADLRARAFFDANNVKVGDPLVLTVDFLGNATFANLHPPALSRAVSAKDWKIDDTSAKTDTYRDARRLTYRVRPMREGVLWFPALEFTYADALGGSRTVRANEIPVHAKPGVQVAIHEMNELERETSAAPVLLAAVSTGNDGVTEQALGEDVLFAWRKALAHPTADAFAAFDFPAARLNEASCALNEGNWSRALHLYRLLEWRIGQTPEIERGLVAVQRLKNDSDLAELPVWRQVLRPILRFAWAGRIGLVLGAFALLAFVFWIIGRTIRAVAALGFALLLALPVVGETVEETVTTNADGSVVHRRVVTGGNGNYSFSFSSSSSSSSSSGSAKGGLGIEPASFFDEDFDPFGMMRRRTAKRPKPVITARLVADRPSVTVGEDFNLVLEVEHPRNVGFADGIQLSLVESGSLVATGRPRPMSGAVSKNPTNVIERIVFPMRANVPVTGPLHYEVAADYVFAGEHSFFRTAYPYRSARQTAVFSAAPPPEAGRPADFAGIISQGLALHEYCDLLRVETNDVVSITYRLTPRGYVPPGYLPKDVAFEAERAADGSQIAYRRYFVADGSPRTPEFVVAYYDPRQKAYRTVKAGGTPLKYFTPQP